MNKTEQIKKIVHTLEAKGCHLSTWCTKGYQKQFFAGPRAECNFMVIADPLSLISEKLIEISKELGAVQTAKMVEKSTNKDLLGIWWTLKDEETSDNLPVKK